MADICFRHLYEAYENSQKKQPHGWIKGISNEDLRFGRSDYLESLNKHSRFESEEFTHSLGASVFSHVWLLSAANYYKIGKINDVKPITGTQNPQSIAKSLNLPEFICTYAKELHDIRNAAMHFIETKPTHTIINSLNFEIAYKYVKTTWVIYCALLRYYKRPPDRGSWTLQTRRYSLPRTLKKCSDVGT
jgi:hypothetical protein